MCSVKVPRARVRKVRTALQPAVRSCAGFTLLEVMVASLLLIVVLFGLANFYTRGRTQVDYEEYRRKATAVAQTRMDALRRDFRYDDLADLDGSDTTYVVDGRNYRVVHDVRSPVPPGSQSTEVILSVIWSLRVGTSTVPDTLQTISMLGRGMP